MENLVNNMTEKLKNAYRGKRVFITGHTGFKGSWLLKSLNFLGADIKGYSLAPKTQNDLYNLINGDSICESVIADLRDKETLTKSVLDFQPDFIFHLAAQPLVRLSYEIPSETFQVNAIGTAHLLDAVRLLEKKCEVILITTDKVYHNNEWEYPYRENDRLGGYDPYSASKACAELVIDCYRNSFFNPLNYNDHKKGIAVARAGNVIGGGDWSKDRLIPDIISSLINQKTINVRNPKAIRPWQHVLEPLLGYLILGEKLLNEPIKYSQAFNFGPPNDDALSVLDLLKLVLQEWESGNFEIEQNINQPHEAGLLKLDTSKANYLLDWKPKFSVNENVSFTINWYKEFVNNVQNINLYTTNQIEQYLGL